MAFRDGRYVYDSTRSTRRSRLEEPADPVQPAQPIGRVLDRGELEAITAVVDRHRGRVFSDEIHAPSSTRGKHTPYASTSVVAAGHTVTATSASKAWNLAGIEVRPARLSNEAEQELWSTVGMMGEHGAANLGVIANTVAYTVGGSGWTTSSRTSIFSRARSRKLVQQHLPGVSYTPPEGTYLAWLDCRALDLGGQEAAEFFMERAGVAMTDGAQCGDVGRGFVRYNFATPRPTHGADDRSHGEGARHALSFRARGGYGPAMGHRTSPVRADSRNRTRRSADGWVWHRPPVRRCVDRAPQVHGAERPDRRPDRRELLSATVRADSARQLCRARCGVVDEVPGQVGDPRVMGAVPEALRSEPCRHRHGRSGIGPVGRRPRFRGRRPPADRVPQLADPLCHDVAGRDR